jgi:hypothetical protein
MALGSAFIEIHADTRPFARELPSELKKILNVTERSIRGDSERIGQRVSDGIGDGVKRNSHKVRQNVQDALTPGNQGGSSGLFATIKRGFLSLGSAAAEFFTKGLGSALSAGGNALASGFETGIKSLGNLLGSIANVSASSGPAAAAIVALFVFLGVVVIPTLVSALVALLGVLSNLLGLLGIIPSAFGVLLAIILPLVAAFQGFGEAISAVLSKDPKKIAEALKGLTPSARSVVKEFASLVPLFSRLADIAQEAFFKPLVGDLKALVNRASLPLLNGFKIVATAAGNLLSSILTALARPEMVIFFDSLFTTAAQTLTTLQGPITNLILAFAKMAEAGLPAFTTLIEKLAGFLDRFSAWITQNIEDGSFQAFLDKAVNTLQDIWDLVKALIELFKTMFQGTEQGGRTFLDLVTRAVERLTAFFESERGQRALQAMIDLTIIFGLYLSHLIGIAGALADQLHVIANILRTIIRLISGVDIRKMGEVRAMGGAIAGLASGGIVNRPTLAMVGEGSAPEVIIPLTDPQRAQQLADQSGLSSMLGGSGGNITLIAYIGGQQVEAFVERKVESAFGSQSRALAYGARVGV